MTDERIDVQRHIAAPPAVIFEVLSRPSGHVAIDASGMLLSAEGSVVTKEGDSFVVHMDREALNDRPLGKYDVTVTITAFQADAHIEWTVGTADHPSIGHRYGYQLEPEPDGTLVTSYCDWSRIPASPERDGAFPVVPEQTLRATLGILARTVTPPSAQ